MDNGICLNSMIPLRDTPDRQGELTDQLLFGEHFRILESQGEWHHIRRLPDGYEGWMKSLYFLRMSGEWIAAHQQKAPWVAGEPFMWLNIENEGMWIAGGSLLPDFDPSTGSFTLSNRHCTVQDKSGVARGMSRGELAQAARNYLNAPYLWGGKTVFGMDCSGFTQILARMGGIVLPRDSHQQVHRGTTVGFIKDARPGDLAFFDNEEGEIIHTGMMLDPNHIIHASGKVRIDAIDHQGIYNRELKQYTHTLRVIINIMDEPQKNHSL